KWIAEGNTGTVSTSLRTQQPRSLHLWQAAAFIFLLASVILAVIALRNREPQKPLELSVIPPENLHRAHFAVSPHGSRVIFEAGSPTKTWQLWMRRLDSFDAQALPGTENGRTPFWSPDNRFIGFCDDTAQALKKMDLSGGPPETLYSPAVYRGGTWN